MDWMKLQRLCWRIVLIVFVTQTYPGLDLLQHLHDVRCVLYDCWRTTECGPVLPPRAYRLGRELTSALSTRHHANMLLVTEGAGEGEKSVTLQLPSDQMSKKLTKFSPFH